MPLSHIIVNRNIAATSRLHIIKNDETPLCVDLHLPFELITLC